MSWVAGGVFKPMLHKVDDDAATITVNGVRYWWSTCVDFYWWSSRTGPRLCVALPQGFDESGIPLCPKCFPEEEESHV